MIWLLFALGVAAGVPLGIMVAAPARRWWLWHAPVVRLRALFRRLRREADLSGIEVAEIPPGAAADRIVVQVLCYGETVNPIACLRRSDGEALALHLRHVIRSAWTRSHAIRDCRAILDREMCRVAAERRDAERALWWGQEGA